MGQIMEQYIYLKAPYWTKAAQSHNKSKRWLVTIIFYDTEEKKNVFDQGQIIW